VLSIVGIVALVYGLIEGPQLGWASPQTLIAFAVAAVVLSLFAAWSCVSMSRCSTSACSVTGLQHGTGGMILIFLSMFAVMFLVTQYFQLILGYTPLSASLRFCQWRRSCSWSHR